jgi:two-component system chemotaxis response regulator CheY
MTRKILIVDDSPVMRKMVQRVLELSGFDTADCFSAGNGLDALDLLRHQSVDLILSDINMPQMDGEAFLQALGADERLRSIPVLVLSTDATSRRMRNMFALGAVGYLSKPFTPEALQAELRRVVGAIHG